MKQSVGYRGYDGNLMSLRYTEDPPRIIFNHTSFHVVNFCPYCGEKIQTKRINN